MHDAFFLGPEALLCRTRGPDAVPQTREDAKRGETYQIAFDRLLDEVASAEKQVLSRSIVRICIQLTMRHCAGENPIRQGARLFFHGPKYRRAEHSCRRHSYCQGLPRGC